MNQASDLESNDHAIVSQTPAQCSMNTVHAPTSTLTQTDLSLFSNSYFRKRISQSSWLELMSTPLASWVDKVNASKFLQ